ncbi:MAG: DNA methyltransferase [Chloroflexi bacterium]|nr:DNA methyltransferase [Chloroflexota bacterium]
MTDANFAQLPLTQGDTHFDDQPASGACLGLTFADDTARRTYFRERLREKLADPAFRAIEGFPIGDDETILALSDPPYYTACPNPFLAEIIAEWQEQRRATREQLGLDSPPLAGEGPGERSNGYHCEPFAADVSEGKGDPIYNAHSYHTKVPHKAIMRYILHYTAPGDIVLDGFCGTGMTGVAAQLCGDRRAVTDLGYRVDSDGTIYEGTKPISRLGAREAALADLSPIATFIAYNYNTPVDAAAFEREATRILAEVRVELGWMYETVHVPPITGSLAPRGRDEPRAQGPMLRNEQPDGSLAPRGRLDDEPRAQGPMLQNAPIMGRINYTVWSEVFLCPQCSGEIVFLDEALDEDTQRVRETFACPHCGAQVTKRSLDKCRTTVLDPVLGRTVETLKRKPVLIEYTVGGSKYTKSVDPQDLEVLDRIERLPMPADIPTNAFPIAQMYHGSRLAPKGVTHVHQLFQSRPRHALHTLWTKALAIPDPRLHAMLLFAFEQAIWGMSLLNRYGPTHYSQVNRYLSGVYYISSLISEVSPWYILDGKTDRIARAFGASHHRSGGTAITTQSATAATLPDDSIDYIFTDPPFGENIYYADLNYLLESWHGVRTNSGPEAIIDQAKRKTLADYQELMRACFRRFYAALKPGRWMTVEFHNSHNAVWRAVQEALMSAGFVVADTRTLDKQQASYRQVTAASAAKQDLVISAYKPTSGFEQRFLSHAGTEEAAWDFVRHHLAHVPTVVWGKNDRIETVAERQNYLLFDRMVAYHIQRGVAVPLGAAACYAGLRDRFVERDGMYFLPEQTAEYDQARLRAAGMAQLAMFVSDEKSAVAWLRGQLLDQPGSFQEIQPHFLQELHQARHEALPDLRVLLEENFLQDEAGRWYVPDPNKAEDLEKLRLRGLLREFQDYVEGRGRLRQFRTEAVRAGFGQAWHDRDFATIVKVAERLPEDVLQEDPDLLMYYDNASLRVRP